MSTCWPLLATSTLLETLPGSLGEALEELKQDQVVQEALGSHIYHRYLSAKTQEWNEYRLSVSQWELDRYLPRYEHIESSGAIPLAKDDLAFGEGIGLQSLRQQA